jgi:hypothetical protein
MDADLTRSLPRLRGSQPSFINPTLIGQANQGSSTPAVFPALRLDPE